MQRKHFHALAVVCMIAFAITAALPLSAAPAAAPANAVPTPNVPGNLLANPSFEAPYVKQCCHTDPEFPPNTPVDEVQVPVGWRAWWREASFPDFPPRCDDARAPKFNCVAFHRPEWRDSAAGTAAATFANRIRSGLNSQKYFTFYSIHESGMYQQVSRVRVGQRLQFTVYMQAWSTDQAENLVSAGQQTMNLKVGIDPFGGTDPFSPNIVWSRPGDSYDVFSQFSIEAVARNTTITVFTYSRPVYALQHNDVYIDDAALIVVGTGSVPPSTGSGGSGSTSSQPTSPFPDTTVDKDGNIIYVIQVGDTAWGLAQRFNTTVSQLAAWNKDRFPDITVLRIGKTIIVGKIKVTK